MTRRAPVVLQTSQTECGLCAVLSLMGCYGRRETTVALRTETVPGRDGLSVGALVRLLRSRGFETKAFRVANGAALATLERPVLLFWERYHWVLLERMSKGRATIIDPAYGRRVVSGDELAKSFSGIIIDAVPGASFSRRRLPLLNAWRSLPLRAPSSGRIVLAVLLVLAGSAISLGLPWLTQVTIDSFIAPDGISAGLILLGVIAAAAAFYLVSLARTFVFSRITAVLGFHLMTGIFEKLLRLPFSYFATRPTGELMFRLSSGNAVRDLLSTRFVQLIIDVATLVTLLAYLTFLSPPIAVFAVATVAIAGVLLIATSRAVAVRIDAELAALSKTQIMQLDAISAIDGVKMAAADDHVLDQWREGYATAMSTTQSRTRLQQGVIGSAISGIQIFGPLFLLIAALWPAFGGQVSLGQAVAIQAAGAILFGVVGSLYTAYTDIARTSRAVDRLSDITETEPERTGGRRPSAARGELGIELDRVTFWYSDDATPAVDGVSARIQPGSVTAIVGPSGSGKSTLAGLLCTLYEARSGTVRIGGDDVSDLDLDLIRSRIGYVPQSAVLLNGTILENLTMGTALAMPTEVIERRCREMEFLDFVDDLPMGYRTIVSDLGGNLSGGQRQRLTIARVLLSDPDMIVLDEATSALDTRNERLVAKHLARLGCTRILVAHREATVQTADEILVLEHGRLVQRGCHEDLIAQPGAYRTLYGEEVSSERWAEPVTERSR